MSFLTELRKYSIKKLKKGIGYLQTTVEKIAEVYKDATNCFVFIGKRL